MVRPWIPKRSFLLTPLASIVLLAFAFTGTATASPIVAAGNIIRLYDSFGNTGGGEFNGQIVGTSPAVDFISFCLETNEFFTPGQDLLVSGVSNAARAGGVGGGNPDPISNLTAYLFTQFSLGTLSNYSFGSTGADRVADANSLQRALWFLEEETTSLTDIQASLWVDEAQKAVAAGWSNSQVRVLNLMRRDGSGNFTIRAQDQLYFSVSEPSTLLLMGAALLGLAVARSRRQALN